MDQRPLGYNSQRLFDEKRQIMHDMNEYSSKPRTAVEDSC